MLVVGDSEQEVRQVAVREHRRGDTGSASVEEFVARVQEATESLSKR